LALAEISRGIKEVGHHWRGDPAKGDRGDEGEEDGLRHGKLDWKRKKLEGK
jgi:hypothetical protein